MPYTDILYSVGCLARLGAAAGNDRADRVSSESASAATDISASCSVLLHTKTSHLTAVLGNLELAIRRGRDRGTRLIVFQKQPHAKKTTD